MEQRYKTALELILNLCTECYPSVEEVKILCRTALETEEAKESEENV